MEKTAFVRKSSGGPQRMGCDDPCYYIDLGHGLAMVELTFNEMLRRIPMLQADNWRVEFED